MRRNKRQKKSFVVTLCLLLTMVLGIGYAVLSQHLSINGGLQYGTMKWNVGFKSVTDGGGTINSNPTIADDKKSITITCDIGTSTESEICIVNAIIENDSTFAVQLESNPTITYDNTYISSVNAVWSDDSKNIVKSDTITSDSEREMTITITTRELTSNMLPENVLSIPITLTMNWIEQESNDVVVSILGDSISTLKGYIPATNRARYVQTEAEAVDGLIYMKYEQTWWGRIIEEQKYKLGINNSWAGSLVSNTQTTDSGDMGPNSHMASMTRLKTLDDNGTPDIIFFFGGTNDAYKNMTIGQFDSSLQLNTTQTEYASFAEAYHMAILRIKNLYPNTEIISIGFNYTKTLETTAVDNYNKVIAEICKYYNIKYINLRNSNFILNTDLADNAHPTSEGMRKIANYITYQLEYMNSERTNLYDSLNLYNEYYNASGVWTTNSTSSNPIVSMLIDVNPGEKIISNSFGAKEVNGNNGYGVNGTTNGVRISYLKDGIFVKSVSPADVYTEFSTNGYIIVPEGVDEINVCWWNSSEDNYLYIY